MGNHQATISATQIAQKACNNAPKTTKQYSAVLNHVNNSLLVYGGYPGTFSNVYELSHDNFYWHELKCNGIIPHPRFSHACFVYHEYMYIIGGETQSSVRLADVHRLNLETYEWSEIHCTGTGPSVRSGHTCVVYKGKAIVFGGERSSGSYLNDLYELNLETFVWTCITSNSSKTQNEKTKKNNVIPKPRGYHSAVIHGDSMYVFGGKSNSKTRDDLYQLDLKDYTWTHIRFNKTNSPSARYSHSCVCISGMLMIFGGITNNEEVLNPSSTSSICTPHTSTSENEQFEYILEKYHFKCVEYQGKCLLIGGRLHGQMITEVLEIDMLEFQRIMDVPFSEFEVIEKIGDGSFREVFLAKWRGEKVALKVMKQKSVFSQSPMTPTSTPISIKSNFSNSGSIKNVFGAGLRRSSKTFSSPTEFKKDDGPMSKYVQEMNILRQLKHPNIVNFKCMSIKDKEQMAVATEYCNLGNLNEVLLSEKLIEWEQKVTMCLDIARAMFYLHHKNIVHGNLTSLNVLATNKMRLKLSDFFISAKLVEQNTLFDKIKLLKVPYYLSPQILNEEQAKQTDDVYAFGIMMWEIFSRNPLFSGATDYLQLTESIKSQNLRPCSPNTLDMLLSNKYHDNEVDSHGNGKMNEQKRHFLRLMKKCWNSDPDDRPSFEQIIRVLKSCTTTSHKSSAKTMTSQTGAIESEIKALRYEKCKLIGRGGQATVFLIQDKTTLNYYALKKFFSCKMDELNLVLQEMRTYVSLNHQCLVQVKDFFISEINPESGDCCFNLVMDYCDGGDMANFIKLKKASNQYIDSMTMFQMAYELFEGVRYIHSQKIIHRDLKPQNVFLIKNSNQIKIGDLGLAKEQLEGSDSKSYVGTINYMAPVDLWALGVILFELITLQSFEYGQFMSNKQYLDDHLQPVKNNYHQILLDITKMCLHIDPIKRPKPDVVIKWLMGSAENGELDELRLLHENPASTPENISNQHSIFSIFSTQKESLEGIPERSETSQLGNVEILSNKPSIENTESDLSERFSFYSNSLNYQCILKWNINQVKKWVSDVMHYPQYGVLFEAHEINGEALLTMTSVEDFNYIGITKLGHIKLLMKYISKFAE